MTLATSIDSKMAATTAEQLAVPNCMVRAATFNPFTQISLVPLFDLTRYELQARILANQPTEEIASRVNLPTDTVTGFESAEFDVRSQLMHPSVVLHRIISVPADEEWSASDLARFWMWAGFTYGAIALDLIVPPFRSLSPELRSLGLRAYLLPNCDVPEEFRMVVAGKLTPIAATASAEGQRLIKSVHRVYERRIGPVDLLNSLLVLAERPKHVAVDRGQVRDYSPRLKESA